MSTNANGSAAVTTDPFRTPTRPFPNQVTTIEARCPQCVNCQCDSLNTYAACADCGHVSPTREHLERHRIHDCCGRLGRAA